MEEKFYTVDEVANILGLHPKTIRKFIREGKLIANKVGKQWRITGNDLSNFTERNSTCKLNLDRNISEGTYTTEETITGNKPQKVQVSAVVDIIVEDEDEALRISNTLIAVSNSKDPQYGKSTVNIQQFKNNNKIRIMLWGSCLFVENMLSTISVMVNKD